MNQHQVNFDLFSPEERRHIIHLNRIAKRIREKKEKAEKNGYLGKQYKDELSALEWTFKILNEITEEDD